MEDGASLGRKSELLDVLSEVKTRVQDKLGDISFPVPQFILIGRQSVGKSRLLESLAGEQFNFVSGSLGSRRPTVLEFRNMTVLSSSRWFVLEKSSNRWVDHPLSQVMKIIGEAHESLGATVCKEPVYVRVESPVCVDMQIVDLPGFREFALDADKKDLKDQIEALVTSFMKDERNVMLCVEEAGDAANLSTLARCKQLDPKFERTVLIRNKLDKYYRDLSVINVNQWLNGYGDLPTELRRFALTLPHWANESEAPNAPFAKLRDEADERDVSELRSRGASEVLMPDIGFKAFAAFIEHKLEDMFISAIGPILQQLRKLREETENKANSLQTEIEDSHPDFMLSTVREVGMSFSHALSEVMQGYVRADESNLFTLEHELQIFHRLHESNSEVELFASEEFGTLEDYLDYLRDEVKVPGYDMPINGGAQFRRLMFEVEVFLRFSEVNNQIRRRDVMQARGVSLQELTWRDVAVKILCNEARIPLERRVRYVGERLRWFFEQQKEPTIDFMGGVKTGPDKALFSSLFTKHHQILVENELVRNLVFSTYDRVLDEHLKDFIAQFDNLLAATLANPWVVVKGSTMALREDDLEDVCMPTLEDTKERVPFEITNRGEADAAIETWCQNIPVDARRIDDAVDSIQILILRLFGHIRSQLCDHVELFTDSFFKLPMLRRLEEDMANIQLSVADVESYTARRHGLEGQLESTEEMLGEVETCIDRIQSFTMRFQTGAGRQSLRRRSSVPASEAMTDDRRRSSLPVVDLSELGFERS